jgi:hypothetical protein
MLWWYPLIYSVCHYFLMIGFNFHELEALVLSLAIPLSSEIYYLGLIYVVYISVATKLPSFSMFTAL